LRWRGFEDPCRFAFRVSSAFLFPLPLSPLLPAGASAAPGGFWRPSDPDLVHVVGDGRRASGFLLVVMVCLGPNRCAPPPLIALVAARPPSRLSLPHSQPPGLTHPGGGFDPGLLVRWVTLVRWVSAPSGLFSLPLRSPPPFLRLAQGVFLTG
jgi:hypothetical protein